MCALMNKIMMTLSQLESHIAARGAHSRTEGSIHVTLGSKVHHSIDLVKLHQVGHQVQVANVAVAVGVVATQSRLSTVVEGGALVKNIEVHKLVAWVLFHQHGQHMTADEPASACSGKGRKMNALHSFLKERERDVESSTHTSHSD